MNINIGNDTYDGEITFKLYDKMIEDNVITYCELTIGLPELVMDFSHFKCFVGLFKDIQIDEILFGTKDVGVLYRLSTSNFQLDVDYLNKLFISNEQKEGE